MLWIQEKKDISDSMVSSNSIYVNGIWTTENPWPIVIY